MDGWKRQLRNDPVPALLSFDNRKIQYFTRKDLLGENPGPVRELWKLQTAQKILRKQLDDGSWKYPGKRSCKDQDYELLETYRNLAILVECYGLNVREPAVKAAADFMLSRQTDEGDIRGIYGKQYTPNYTGAILEIIVKSGLSLDRRVKKGFEWLLSIRQKDGGWALPCLTKGKPLDRETMEGPLIEPDKSKPFSHLMTGMALRAFAAHPDMKKAPEALKAGELLASRFFKRDATYSGRHTPEFWTRFSHPFWFTDLLTSLDSLSRMGVDPDEPNIARGLDWFRKSQLPTGLWQPKLLRTGDKDVDLWVDLSICRVFKNFYD
jgi:hypothetical protein